MRALRVRYACFRHLTDAYASIASYARAPKTLLYNPNARNVPGVSADAPNLPCCTSWGIQYRLADCHEAITTAAHESHISEERMNKQQQQQQQRRARAGSNHSLFRVSTASPQM